MAAPLKAALINYFVQLESTNLKWKEFVENIKHPTQGLKNQSEQYCYVTSEEVVNAEICQMDDLREKLIFKISMGIEDEVSRILKEIRRLKNHIEDLKMKFNRLENARSDAVINDSGFKELVQGTAHIPKLNLLMEWSIESYNYYSQLYADVFEKWKTLNYRDTYEVAEWAKLMNRYQRDQGRIRYILGFTQFLAKETTKCE